MYYFNGNFSMQKALQLSILTCVISAPATSTIVSVAMKGLRVGLVWASHYKTAK